MADPVKCSGCGRTFPGKAPGSLCPVCAEKLVPFNPPIGQWLLAALLAIVIGGFGYWLFTRRDDKVGADPQDSGVKVDNSVDSGSPPAGHPSDFFPSSPGTTWTYDIQTAGEDHPLMYEQVSWPLAGDQAVTYATRGILYSRAHYEGKRGDGGQRPRAFALQLRVKGPAPKQGPLQYPKGVELAVLKDDLGIFRDHKQVFWAITESGRYSANLVVTRSGDSPAAPGSGGFGGWGRPDGSAMRLFFFADKPGIQISLNRSPDALLFTGVERNLQGNEGVECLHFVRSVKATEAKEDNEPDAKAERLNKGFTEDVWFARGKGLVRLEQKVEGAITMIWSLKTLSMDRK